MQQGCAAGEKGRRVRHCGLNMQQGCAAGEGQRDDAAAVSFQDGRVCCHSRSQCAPSVRVEAHHERLHL
eukprot:365949-Chlamydomonas_euryale.AAC.4